MRKSNTAEVQLSLFEPEDSAKRKSNEVDLQIARFEQRPDMTKMTAEEYKRWIRHLINASFNKSFK